MLAKYISIILYFICLSCISCDSSHVEKNRNDCVNYNNTATDFAKHYDELNDTIALKQAIKYYSLAIQCDSNNYSFRHNLISLYLLSGDDKALSLQLNKVLLKKPNDPYLLLLKGVVFDRNNQMDSSSYYYNLANDLYLLLLKSQPENSNFKIAYVSFLTIYKDKEYAIVKINEYLFNDPGNSVLLNFKEYLVSDRFNFLPLRK